MIALALTLALAASPELGLVQRSTKGVADKTTAVVVRQITQALQAEGFTVRPVGLTCSGDAKCLATIARTPGLAAVVAVTLSLGRRDLTVDLEAIDGLQRQLAVRTFGAPSTGSPFPPEAAEFFQELKTALTPPPVTDEPKIVHLEPQHEDRVEVVAAPTNTLLRATAVTTLVTGVAAIVLVIAAGAVKGQLDSRIQKGGIVPGTRQQAQSQADLANGLGTASAVTCGIAGAAAVATGILWFQE